MNEGSSKEELMKQVFGIRLTISSGYGDFGIASIVNFYLARTKSPFCI